jgi:hypothetical protein
VAHTASLFCMGVRGWLANLRRIGPEGRHTAVGYILLQGTKGRHVHGQSLKSAVSSREPALFLLSPGTPL